MSEHVFEDNLTTSETDTIDSSQFVYQLTMNTLVNQDALRKIQYKNVKILNRNDILCFKDQVSEWIRILGQDDTLSRKDVPEEIQIKYDIFIKSCYSHWKKMFFPENVEDDQNEYQNSNQNISDINESTEAKNDKDSKEISLLPIFMKYQHPVWNNSRFNKKKGDYTYPHLQTSSKQYDISVYPSSFPER